LSNHALVLFTRCLEKSGVYAFTFSCIDIPISLLALNPRLADAASRVSTACREEYEDRDELQLIALDWRTWDRVGRLIEMLINPEQQLNCNMQ
jgi:hypothetical protein